MYVPRLIEEIPKKQLILALKEEVSHFMATLMHTPLPTSVTRLRLPVIETSSKAQEAEANKSILEKFVETYYEVPGEFTELATFLEHFWSGLTPQEMVIWSRRVIQNFLIKRFPVGIGPSGQLCIGNLSLDDRPQTNSPYILQDRKLEHEDSNLP
jgi:hypothetical protein